MRKFLVLTGPSAVGKSTILNYMLNCPDFHLSVSYTTRTPRPWEVCGVDYYFVTKEQFQEKLAAGFFLEHTLFSGNYYGTPAHPEMEGKVVIFDVDLRGYYFFRKQYPDSYFCLVTADREIVKIRLAHRMRTQNQTLESREAGQRLKSFDDFVEISSQEHFNKIIENSRTIEEGWRQADTLIQDALGHFSHAPGAPGN